MLRRVIPLVAVLLLCAWSSDAMQERDVGATDFNTMLINCKDRNLAEFWREISTKTSAARQSGGFHYDLQFYRKGKETNLSNDSEDKHYHCKLNVKRSLTSFLYLGIDIIDLRTQVYNIYDLGYKDNIHACILCQRLKDHNYD